MKLQKVAKLCKKTGVMRIFYGANDWIWYISDGVAAYPVHGVPVMDKDSLFTMFDYDQKTREGILYTEAQLNSGVIDFADKTDGEVEAKLGTYRNMQICHGGYILQPLGYKDRLLLFDVTKLAPLEQSQYRALYVRVAASGVPYVVVKDGELLVAAILPMLEVPEEFTTALEDLVRDAKREAELRAMEGHDLQVRLIFDPETGEVEEA